MYSKNKIDEKFKEDVLIELPYFIDQLLLLLGSGMVLQEALITIGEGYEAQGGEDNAFIMEYRKLYRETQKGGKNMVNMLEGFNQKHRIKELSKVISIIIDGNKRGIDLWDKLAEHRDILWNERKRRAMEKIRVAETKMSFPLGLLLIALLLITAAPAMMQM